MRIAHYLHVDKRLKSFRMGADMSQKEMAAKLELSVPTYFLDIQLSQMKN